jgi:hypothetical protein
VTRRVHQNRQISKATPAAPPSSVMNSRRFIHNLIGAAEQRQRDSDAERLGGLQIQKEFNFGGLLNRQLGRLLALAA